MRGSRNGNRAPGWSLAVALTGMLVMLAVPLGAQNACIKNIGSAAPTLNGVVAGGLGSPGCDADVVWQGVEPVEMWSGGSPSGGLTPGGYLFFAFRNPAGPNNDRLWVGVDIAGDDNVTNWDVIYLIFDADNNNAWNAGDFLIKVPASSSSALINSGAQCDSPCGTMEYWEHNGSTWQQIAGPEAFINARMAYDYEGVVDPETHLWNVEIDMPVAMVIGPATRFNLNTTAAPFFAIGAYVFVDRNHLEDPNPQEGTVLRWPQTMKERTITQQNFDGLPLLEATELGGVALTNTCFDVNFDVADPWRINGFIANAYDNRIVRNALNTFRVRFKYQGPDGGTGTLANTGSVRVTLTPYNASGAGTAYAKVKTLPASGVATYPGEYYVDFTWNFGTAGESWSAFESATGHQVNFVCARMELVGFARDDNTSNNTKVVNHNEFTTSEYVHQVAILGDAVPGLRDGQTANLRLRLQSLNDPTMREGETGVGAPLDFLGNPAVTVLWAAGVLLALVLLYAGRRTRAVRAGYALLGASAVLAGCQQIREVIQPLGGQPQRVQITNASQIGLRPIPDNPGWYELPIRYGEVKHLELRFTGRPLPYRTVQRRIQPADSAGRLTRSAFAVRPGQVVTVVAFGEVDMDGPNGPLPRTSPTGMSLPETQTTLRAAATSGGLLLRDGYYRASQHIGALVGSFDNWRSTFVVGRAGSFVVPDGATSLQLAVNGPVQGARMIDGVYDVNVITTPLPATPTHAYNRGDATFRIPPTFDPWRVLTSYNVFTYRVVEDRSDAGRVIGNTLVPLGEAHYTVYATHDR